MAVGSVVAESGISAWGFARLGRSSVAKLVGNWV